MPSPVVSAPAPPRFVMCSVPTPFTGPALITRTSEGELSAPSVVFNPIFDEFVRPPRTVSVEKGAYIGTAGHVPGAGAIHRERAAVGGFARQCASRQVHVGDVAGLRKHVTGQR